MQLQSHPAFIASLLSIVLLDQGTKYIAPDVILNQGVSFGLFSSSLLSVALLAVLVAIAVKWGRFLYLLSPVATGIFFGGAVSNIIDRFLFGGVRDFLPVPLLNVRNNVADWAIILALFWLFFARGYNTREKRQETL